MRAHWRHVATQCPGSPQLVLEVQSEALVQTTSFCTGMPRLVTRLPLPAPGASIGFTNTHMRFELGDAVSRLSPIRPGGTERSPCPNSVFLHRNATSCHSLVPSHALGRTKRHCVSHPGNGEQGKVEWGWGSFGHSRLPLHCDGGGGGGGGEWVSG